MRRLPIIILTSFIAFAALAVVTHSGDSPLPAAQAQGEEPAQGITVHGHASVKVVPDQAQLWFGVESDGATARAALAAGPNHVAGPHPPPSDTSEVYRQALGAAVADPRESAAALADSADLTL